MELREYQQQGIDAVLRSWESQDRVLVSMPTGTGKTVLFGALLQQLLSERPGSRALILAHRDELISQACDKWKELGSEIIPGVVKGARNEWEERLVVASIQSLHARRREQIREPFDFLVIDEAHHAQPHNSYGEVITWAQNQARARARRCKVLGVTATPYRGDHRGLGGVFESVAFSYPIVRAVEEGHLSPLDAYQIRTGVNLDLVEPSHGDLNQRQLSAVINTADCNRLVVAAYRRYCPGDKAVAFCVDVAHTQALAAGFRGAGIPAAAIYGAMSEDARREALRAFQAGELRVLTNCMVLTEGWDCPDLGAVLLVRPTCSQVVYVQQVGRVTRLFPGKDSGKVLDFTWNTSRHRLVSFADLSRAHARQADARPGAGEGIGHRQIQIRPRGKGLRAYHVNILGESRLAAGWSEFGTDWFASWGGTSAILRPLDPYELDGTWRAFILTEVSSSPRRHELETIRGPFTEAATETQELIVSRLGNNVIARANAGWKRRPVSEKLRAACEKWNIQVDEAATMGEASAMLGYAIACSNLRRASRATPRRNQ